MPPSSQPYRINFGVRGSLFLAKKWVNPERGLFSIRDEEKQHVGELLSIIQILDPKETEFLDRGNREVHQMLGTRV